ncbi:MAG: DotI/IcmL/TraM family protein [Desulfovibrio sp.]|nr:DotI/IcmL/TraM family protein [Desulfovibrio sp.]
MRNKSSSLFHKNDAPASQKNAVENPEPDAPSPLFDGKTVYGGLQWYQAHYRRAMQIAIVLAGGLCLSITVIGALVVLRPTPVFFAATPDLRLAEMVPLDKPVLTQQGLLNWATETVTNAVSLDFLEWRKKLTAAREHFSEPAFKSFLSSLESSGILGMIQDKRLSASAVVTQAPVIVASGMIDGKASWKIEFPIIISYESSQGVESTQKLLAVVLARRASTVRSPRGVVIEQVVLKRDA